VYSARKQGIAKNMPPCPKIPIYQWFYAIGSVRYILYYYYYFIYNISIIICIYAGYILGITNKTIHSTLYPFGGLKYSCGYVVSHWLQPIITCRYDRSEDMGRQKSKKKHANLFRIFKRKQCQESQRSR